MCPSHPRARAIGSYLGLRPRRAESGTLSPQLHITKAGDKHLRALLVECAHHILGPGLSVPTSAFAPVELSQGHSVRSCTLRKPATNTCERCSSNVPITSS